MPETVPQWDADQVWWVRADRHAAERPTTLRSRDAAPFDATILNISSSGCMIQSAREIHVGAPISLGIAGLGAVPAHVIRREDDRYGCAFTRTLPDAALAGLGSGDTVVQLSLRDEAQADALDDPAGWAPGARLLFALGAAAALWGVILLLI